MLQHLGDLGALAQPDAVDVDVEAGAPVAVRDGGGGSHGPADAGVVDGDVDAAEARDGGGDGGLDRVLRGHVDDQREARRARVRGLDLAGHGAQVRLVDVGQRKLADAVLGEPECGTPPDAYL